MPQYYGITRSSEYLAHYGVKGMKWGVRKAIERGSDRALARQYRKAQRKLNKLKKLGINKEKYKKRAIAYGLGAAKLGGLAAAGTSGVANGVGFVMKRSALGKAALSGRLKELSGSGIFNNTNQGKALAKYSDKLMQKAKDTAKRRGQLTSAIKNYGESDSIAKRLVPVEPGRYMTTTSGGKNVVNWSPDLNQNHIARKITNEQYLRGAAALGAAGLGVAAARNAYRAKTADKNILRAAQFQAEMNRAFAGTKYANGIPQKQRRKSK